MGHADQGAQRAQGHGRGFHPVAGPGRLDDFVDHQHAAGHHQRVGDQAQDVQVGRAHREQAHQGHAEAHHAQRVNQASDARVGVSQPEHDLEVGGHGVRREEQPVHHVRGPADGLDEVQAVAPAHDEHHPAEVGKDHVTRAGPPGEQHEQGHAGHAHVEHLRQIDGQQRGAVEVVAHLAQDAQLQRGDAGLAEGVHPHVDGNVVVTGVQDGDGQLGEIGQGGHAGDGLAFHVSRGQHLSVDRDAMVAGQAIDAQGPGRVGHRGQRQLGTVAIHRRRVDAQLSPVIGQRHASAQTLLRARTRREGDGIDHQLG